MVRKIFREKIEMLGTNDLLQSMVGERIWNLIETDRFKEVQEYFARGMPGWTVVKIDSDSRIIWLRDDRRNKT